MITTQQRTPTKNMQKTNKGNSKDYVKNEIQKYNKGNPKVQQIKFKRPKRKFEGTICQGCSINKAVSKYLMEKFKTISKNKIVYKFFKKFSKNLFSLQGYG